MNLLFSQARTVIFGHRGASAHAPENTLASFRLAAQQGAEAVELDAKLTTDGEVFVFHDLSLQRTTDGKGMVKDIRFAQLRELDAGSWFSAEFAGEKIPTLGEVFEGVGKNLFINIELTNYASPRDGLPDEVVKLVKQHGMENRVLFSSFNPFNLSRVRRLLPGAKVGILAWRGFKGGFQRGFIGRWFSPEFVHPELRDVNEKYIQHEHASGRRVNVWTVNQAEDLQRLFQWKADGVFTDDPALAVGIREGKITP
jgi:glycerophosphoryl diester phosphodiesterase